MGAKIVGVLAAVLVAGLSAAWVQAEEGQGEVRIFINGEEVKVDGQILAARPDGERADGPRAWLGVELAEADGGVRVAAVMPDSPAAKAGLKADDVITAVGGKGVDAPAALAGMVGDRRPGDRLVLSVKRDGRAMEVKVTLGDRGEGEGAPPPRRMREGRPEGEGGEATPPRRMREGRPEGEGEGATPPRRTREGRPEGEGPGRGGQVGLGITAAPMPPEMKEIAGTDKGVLINTITDGSPAAKAGLLAGDVITAIDGEEILRPAQVVDLTRRHKAGDQVKVTYYRMGKRQETTVTLGEIATAAPPLGRGQRPMEIPEEFYKNLPELRGLLEGMLPKIEEWAQRQQPQMPPGATPPAPGTPVPDRRLPQGGPQAAPYDMGKDMGRIMERLDRIEQRLSEIEKRLNQREGGDRRP